MRLFIEILAMPLFSEIAKRIFAMRNLSRNVEFYYLS